MSISHLKNMHIEFPVSWYEPAMPGYGTFPWPHVTPEQNYAATAKGMQKSIEAALAVGYRHIDTAYAYCNQEQVGKAVKAMAIPRGDVFVTSKLNQHDNDYDKARVKIREAIKMIWGNALANEKYLDAFLLHYPGKGHPLRAWKALQEARDQGLVLHIGVSNFEIWHLEALEKKTGELPKINQIEFHPLIYHEQRELLMYCKERGIAVEGYSPLAQGIALQDLAVQRIASAYETESARIVLKWCMQHGVRPIIGSHNLNHLRVNAEPYNFLLGRDEMQLLDGLGNTNKIRISEQWSWNPKTATLGEELQ